MKTRQGLVSNSSTCSFVVIGIPVTPKQIGELAKKFGEPDMDEWEFREWLEEERGFVIEECEGKPSNVIGVQVAHMSSDDYGLSESRQPLTQLIEKVEAMQKEYGLDGEITLFTGVRSC